MYSDADITTALHSRCLRNQLLFQRCVLLYRCWILVRAASWSVRYTLHNLQAMLLKWHYSYIDSLISNNISMLMYSRQIRTKYTSQSIRTKPSPASATPEESTSASERMINRVGVKSIGRNRIGTIVWIYLAIHVHCTLYSQQLAEYSSRVCKRTYKCSTQW